MVKLLTGPHGYGSPGGKHISLRVHNPKLFNRQNLRCALLGAGCYPPAIPKIQDCLENSGRYDCVVTSAVAGPTSLKSLIPMLNSAGVELLTSFS